MPSLETTVQDMDLILSEAPPNIEVRDESTLKDDWDFRGVEQLDGIGAVLTVIVGTLDGKINSKSLNRKKKSRVRALG